MCFDITNLIFIYQKRIFIQLIFPYKNIKDLFIFVKIIKSGILKKILLLLIIEILSVNFLFSQQKIQYDDSEIIIKMPEKENIDNYARKKDFQYETNIEKPVTIWDKIRMKLLEWFFKLFSNNGAGPIIRNLLIVGLLVLITIKLLNTNLKSLFFKSKNHVKIDYSAIDENIKNLDLESLIESSLKSKQYRLATRYLFLRTLKILTDKEIIEWKINKTNKDFFVEIKNDKILNQFKNLSANYEYIWYGNFEISEAKFDTIKQSFDNFNKSMI